MAHFWFGLFVLGVGWNFMFIGGTAFADRDLSAVRKTRSGFQRHAGVRHHGGFVVSAGVLVNATRLEIVNYTGSAVHCHRPVAALLAGHPIAAKRCRRLGGDIARQCKLVSPSARRMSYLFTLVNSRRTAGRWRRLRRRNTLADKQNSLSKANTAGTT